MKNHLRSLVAALAAAVSFIGFGGTTYYVSPTGDGTAPTAGFATGYSSIQAAIDAASAGDAVLLDKTTFSVRTEIQVNKAITLGGAGENWETVLDGENANNNILKISVPGATVHSLTYTRCGIKWANKLGLEMAADSMVSNVVARENGNAMADNGQGRYVMNVSAGFVTHCCITNNNAPNNAGIKLSGSSKMENCYIADNVDRGYSGTMFYGIVVVEGSATVCNCTIINNKSDYSAFYYGSSNAKVYNNIIWGNTTKTEPSATANWKFNQTGWLKTNWKCNCLSPADDFPIGNFDKDPKLEADRLHIPSTSPCFGTADASVAPKTDIELNARGEFPCIGCSEYVPKSVLTCKVKVSADASVLPEEIVLTAEIGGSPSGELSYAWDLNGDGEVDSTDQEVHLSRQGRYLVSLTVMDEAGTPARSSYDKKIFVYDAGAEGLKFYVSPTGDGTDPTKGFATAYPTLKLAFADEDLGDGSMLILDRARFDLSVDNSTREISTDVNIEKRITVTGVGKPDESILDGGREYDGRRWGSPRHYPSFNFKASGIVFRNMTFERMGSDAGQAIYIPNGNYTDCVISNMIFRNTGWGYENWGNAFTAHIMTGNQNAHVSCCVFTNNVFPCAILYMTGNQNALLENCYFANNICTGVKNDNGVVNLNFGGFSGLGWFRNNTVVNNRSKSGAVQHDGWSNVSVLNSIIYGNTDLDGVEAKNYCGNGERSLWKSCCIGEGPDAFPDISNIFLNPSLADDGMHLKASSPCIAKANPSYAPLTDIEGVERSAEAPCIGCSEFVGSGGFTCEVQVSADKTTLPETIALSVAVTGATVGELSYSWDFNGDGKTDSTEAEPVLAVKGKYQVSVVVSDESGGEAASFHPQKIFLFGEGRDGLDYYVSPTGDGTDPTAGFTTAFPTLKRALAEPDLADGDMIILDRARFDLSVDNNAREISTDVDITKRITVTGVGKPDESILDGGREYDGRRWGSPRHYPSFNFKASGIVFRNMTFERMGSDAGQAIYIPNGNYTDCVISNMIFRNTGWGYVNWGNAFTAHVTTGQKNMHVSCCVFTNNVFPCAVLAMTGNRDALLENCYFANNICTGVKTDNGVVSLNFGENPGLGWFRNNTVVNNRSKSGAVQHDGWGIASVLNSIIYGNTDLDGVEPKNYFGTGYRDLWKSCCIGEGPDTFMDASNIFQDPGLADDGMHLTASSPCVGKADPAYAPLTDIDGVERSFRPCIGCSEYLGSGEFSCAIVPPASYVINAPDRLVLVAEVGSAAVKPLTYAWDLDGDGSPDSSEAQPVLTEIGRYAVSLTVTDALGHDAKAFLRDQIIIYPPERTIPSENVFFVTAGNNPGAQPPYSTWETAASTLREAYELAKSVAGATIVLGDGTHEVDSTGGSMLISNGVSVVSLHGHVFSTLNYSGRDKSMFTINDPEALIEGFTVTHPKNNPYASGLVAVLNSGVLRDVVISSIENKGYGVVRVITTADRPVLIERCAFVGNVASGNAGPIALSVAGAGRCTIENSLFARNSSAYACSGYGTLGSALNSSSSALEVRNCTFADNDSMSGLPLHFTATPAVFENNIVVGGTTNNGAFVANDLILKDVYDADKGVLSSVRRSCVFPASADYSGHEKVLTVDPLFVDRAGLDFHLPEGSPCVNAGDKSSVAADAKDFDGKPRIVRGLVDLGCYENQRAYGLQILVR